MLAAAQKLSSEAERHVRSAARAGAGGRGALAGPEDAGYVTAASMATCLREACEAASSFQLKGLASASAHLRAVLHGAAMGVADPDRSTGRPSLAPCAQQAQQATYLPTAFQGEASGFGSVLSFFSGCWGFRVVRG